MRIIEILSMFLPDIYNDLGIMVFASIGACTVVSPFVYLVIKCFIHDYEVKKND